MLLPSIFSSRGVMNDSFDDLFDLAGLSNAGTSLLKEMGSGMVSEMKTDIKETDTAYELQMNLAGVNKEDITASIDDGYLDISVTRTEENEEKETKYLRRERYYGTMSRRFYVGDEVTEEDISAKFDNGVLFVSIPKKEKSAKEEIRRLVKID